MSGAVHIRRLVLLLLLVPVVIFTAIAIADDATIMPLLPDLDLSRVAQVELSHDGDLLLLVRNRGAQGAGWQIRSAADAPGNVALIEDTLERIATIKGRPRPPAAQDDAPARLPVEVRLLDEHGSQLAITAFWEDRAQVQPDGPDLTIARPPALPLWPSAWSSLAAPRINIDRIAHVQRLTATGPERLDDTEAAQMALALGRLSARGFVAGADVDWQGSRMWRVRLADGQTLDLAQVADGEGHFFVRLSSADLADVQASQRFAFRMAESLP